MREHVEEPRYVTTDDDTVYSLLSKRAARTPDDIIAEWQDDNTHQWRSATATEMLSRVREVAKGLLGLGVKAGTMVLIYSPTCYEWGVADFACAAIGAVVVPVYETDSARQTAGIVEEVDPAIAFAGDFQRAQTLEQIRVNHPGMKYVFNFKADGLDAVVDFGHGVSDETLDAAIARIKADDLLTVVYTSGSTGKPKGVMLTHRNILSNINGVLNSICPDINEVWLSFLPLSHTFERLASYYLALGFGNLVAFNRNIGLLQDDLRVIRPTIMMSVPRVYEKIYSKIQDRLAQKSPFVRRLFNWAVDVGWRRFCRENGLPCPAGFSAIFDPLVAGFLDKKVGAGIRNIFGGRPYVFISGGAAFNQQVAKTFLALGVRILQGYGMTEASPVVCVNKLGSNHPQTVGIPLSNLETKLGPNDELMVRGPNVMVGYWMRPEDTKAILTEDGWLKTGDQADIYKSGHIRIKGRIKEIIVTSTGEKIPPGDLEQAIETDNLFDQVMAVGEDRPYIACLAVVNPEQFEVFAKELGKDPKAEGILMDKEVRNAALRRIKALTRDFPNYGIPRNVRLLSEPWTIESGLLTPTLKLKRARIRERFAAEINELYGDRRG